MSLSSKSKRILELDGLRAVAVLAVIGSHAILMYLGNPPTEGVAYFLYNYLFSGKLGVQLFFVISGFIVTHRLLIEIEQNGSISLSGFYARRLFKLLPPVLFLVVFVYSITKIMGLETPTPKCVASALTFTVGFFHPCRWDLNHLWTLTCEEMFYLIWPLILFFSPFVTSKKHYYWILVGGCALVRVGLYKYNESVPFLLKQFLGTLSYADHMGAGVFLAIVRRDLKLSKIIDGFGRSRFLWVALVAIWFPLYFSQTPGIGKFLVPFGPTLQVFGFTIILNGALGKTGFFINGFLRSRLMSGIGLVSYSIYLVQQPILNGGYYKGLVDNSNLAVLAGVILSLFVGHLSYKLVEKPAARVGAGLLRRPTLLVNEC